MKRGFTLIEMVVVLVVIAAVTHFAVREFGHVREQKLEKLADRQLQEIRDAVRGFLADTGRLPIVTNGTLSELWVKPCDLADYRVHQVGGVGVPAGWRGPYLHLPFGRERLTDPWGNEFLVRDEAGFERIGVTNSIYAASVSHYGTTQLVADRRTLSLLPDRGVSSSLSVMLEGSGVALYTVRWYGPSAGGVTGAVATVSANATHRFEGLTPGHRIVAVSDGTRNVAVRGLDVHPGDNLLEVSLPAQ